MVENSWIRRADRARLTRRRLLAAGMATGAAGLFAACTSGSKSSAGPSGTPGRGGSLMQAIVATDAKSFHPYLTTDEPSASFQGYVFGVSLSQRDPKTLEQIPFGATWTLSDDKKTYTFTLKDIQWTDGQPLTTDDFVWTYQQALKPENQYPYADNLSLIDSYVAKDPKTLVVTLKQALTVGLETADSIVPLPRHVWEKYPWSDPSKNPEIMSPSVLSGMWKLKEWKPEDHATFEANDTYFDGRPNIDTMTVRVYGTPEVAFQALKSGQLDYNPAIQPADYKSAKSLRKDAVYEWYPAVGQWSFIGFNLRRPALQDVNLRHALAYATERMGLMDLATYGLAETDLRGLRPGESRLHRKRRALRLRREQVARFTEAGGILARLQQETDRQGRQATQFQVALSDEQQTARSNCHEPQAATWQSRHQPRRAGPRIPGLGIGPSSHRRLSWDLQLGVWSTTIDPPTGTRTSGRRSSCLTLNPGDYI